MNYIYLTCNLKKISEQLKSELPEETYYSIMEYVDHNECGIAFELLCDEIFEYSVAISLKQFEILCELSEQMGFEKGYMDDLKQFIVDA
jgi:hypothetical protein